MSAPGNILLEADEQPRNGVWVDTCDVLANPTHTEVTRGKIAGQRIETDVEWDMGQRLGFLSADDALARALRSDAGDQQLALRKARLLRTAMLDHGVPEVSIELQPGRPNSYGSWDALYVVDEMSHHTVSRFSANLTPVLWLCKQGRSDLPGPLCNGYGGYDLTYRILTFGYANHPGAGGPLTIPAYSGGTYTIPRDSARRYVWGTEWEGGLSSADWDRLLTNPRNKRKMTMREFMGRSNAALREFHEIAHHSEHSTWTSRKIDRLGYTAETGEAELRPYLKEEEMAMDREQFQQWVRRTPISTLVGGKDTRRDRPLEKVLEDLESTQERAMDLLRKIDAKLDALAPKEES